MSMTLKNSLQLGLCAGLVCAVSAQAQTFRHDSASSSLRPPPSQSGASADVYVGGASDIEGTAATSSVVASAASAQEKKFVKEAFSGNLHEVALAQVAERKAQSQELKDYAKHLREDHTAANQQLQTIAQNLGAEVPLASEVKEKQERELNKLNAMSGDEFDKEFAEMALKDHQKDIKKYQAANKFVQSPELKQYITSTLPKLRQHLEHGIQVAQSVGVEQSTIAQYRNTLNALPESVGGSDVTDPDMHHDREDKTTKGAGAKELKDDDHSTHE